MNFLDREKEFIRAKVLPNFDWARFDLPTEPMPLAKAVQACRVALVTTSGAYLAADQERFDTKSPLGDDSFRVIPKGIDPGAIALAHPGYDTRRAKEDLDTVFPYQLLNKLATQGMIGDVSPRHYSFMGFVPSPERLIWRSAPEVGRLLREDGVDLVILVPS
ncbi:glycine/sarcosine/betaine reductase selenoprotein B family protein [Citrifermentans bremense]|uniref:glycine/sarcosine/betaine reductase selenoprotein B family protein n=1 Tax=Citrifermentans bremense TaxID=60035 RepID=UPI0003F774A5|nr:glycine/sarcosine/betaine reductase selenoprotein B family protein [Citrifermentans bremense]